MAKSSSNHSRRPRDEASPPHAAETDVQESTYRVGVLSPHNSKETKAILNAVRALGHDPVWIRDENIMSTIENGTVEVAPSVDVLINRLLLTKSDHPLEDLQLAAIYGDTVPVLNPPSAVVGALHKFRAGVRLARAGLPVPDAVFGRSHRSLDTWPERLSGPAAHKVTIGTNGERMSVVDPDETVAPTIDQQQSFVQEFLDSGDGRPTDIRVYVVGGEVVGAMRRHAPDGDWRTNVALGGEVEDVTAELGERPRRLAIEATDVLGLDVAGVDLLPVDGDWYLLEVNVTAGFKGLYAATGRSAAPAIASLAIRRAGGEVSDRQRERLAGTLDDSVPDCKPTIDPADETRTLGYTTRVTVSGTDAAETVVAKSDTGAERTSIDTELAGRIGAGPLVGTTTVQSGTGGSEKRPLADIDLQVDSAWRTVTASITDRDDVSYPVLLGRDVLTEYTVDVSQRVEE